MRTVIPPRRDRVIVSLIETNVLIRWPCHVCGGHTDKVSILAEVTDGPYAGFRVCESCIQTRDFDAKLHMRAEKLGHQASDLRDLIDSLEVPTFAEWVQRVFETDIELLQLQCGSSDEQIRDHLLRIIQWDYSKLIENANGLYEDLCVEWLTQHGMSYRQIDEQINAIQLQDAKESEASGDIPF